jgi:hypothetical protein
MAFGVLDLSAITDYLTTRLDTYFEDIGLKAVFSVTVSGLAPDQARKGGGCQVSLYLFHMVPEKTMRNTPLNASGRVPVPNDPARSPIAAQPAALELYYLLSAYSETSYVEEQQTMTHALKWLHENPMIRLSPADRSRTYRISIEPQTANDVSQLWQAFSVSLRMALVYRVTTVFIEPLEEHTLPKPVESVNIESVQITP